MDEFFRTLGESYAFLAPLEIVLLCVTAPSILLRRRGRPTAGLAWLFFVVLLPLVGPVFWWLLGRTRLEKQAERRRRFVRRVEARHGAVEIDPDTVFVERMPATVVGQSVFPSRNDRVKLLIDGEQAFPAIEAAIAAARMSINVVFYIWKPDTIGTHLRDLLCERARAGVKVRVLVDAHGSPRFDRAFSQPLRDAGAQVARVMPWKILRRSPQLNFVNHRKIIVIDDEIAFTGGMNVGDEYRDQWRDLMLEIRGKAVRALRHVFLTDWAAAVESVAEAPVLPPCLTELPDAPGHDAQIAVVASGPDQAHSWIHMAYFQAITRATQRVWIATPYFIPSQALLVALQAAEARGVDVRLVVPYDNDVPLVKWASRSYYPQLLEAGARVFEYQGPMLHAKAFVIDDDLTFVGTANVDTRSFHLSFEVGCFMYAESLNAELSAWYASLVDDSHEIFLSQIEQQATWRTLLESAAHLASPLL